MAGHRSPLDEPYDETVVLRWYIVHNHLDLMTEPERQAWSYLTIRKKGLGNTVQNLRTLRARTQVAPDLAAVVEVGEDAFLDLVVSRLLKKREADVLIKRCPVCRKILRTPRARLCLWCGHDWH